MFSSKLQTGLKALFAAGVAVIALVALGSPAQAATSQGSSMPRYTTWYYNNDYYLLRSQFVTVDLAVRGRLAFQTDGNLVFYKDTITSAGLTTKVCWSSNTQWTGYRLAYQGDGNLVIYSNANVAVWASGPPLNGTTVSVEITGVLFKSAEFWVGNKLIKSC